MTAPRRILIATFDGGGNVPPLLTIARKLVARGHAVRVLADEATGAQARAAGLDFVPYRHAPHHALLVLTSPAFDFVCGRWSRRGATSRRRSCPRRPTWRSWRRPRTASSCRPPGSWCATAAAALAQEAQGDPVVPRLEALPQRVLRYSVS